MNTRAPDPHSNYALITGGSSGIGLAFAKLLAQNGFNLILVSENSAALQEAKILLNKSTSVNVETHTIDLSGQQATDDLFEALADRTLNIEILINNAGMYFFNHASEVDPALSKKLINLHVLTTTQLCIRFGKIMKDRGHGHILNVSSMSAVKNFPGIAHYASSKAYLRAFSRSLHLELKPAGVHVTCLIPGATDTNLYDTSNMNMKLGRRLGIMLSPERVAATGLKALWTNKPEVIPGLVTNVIVFLMRIVPYWLIYQIRLRTNYLNEKRQP